MKGQHRPPHAKEPVMSEPVMTDVVVTEDEQGITVTGQIVTPGTLTAVGGWCAPLESLYDMPSISVRRGGVLFDLDRPYLPPKLKRKASKRAMRTQIRELRSSVREARRTIERLKDHQRATEIVADMAEAMSKPIVEP